MPAPEYFTQSGNRIFGNFYSICLTTASTFCSETSCQSAEIIDSTDCGGNFFKTLEYPYVVESMTELPSGNWLYCGSFRGDSAMLYHLSPKGALSDAISFNVFPNQKESMLDIQTASGGVIAHVADPQSKRSYFYKLDPQGNLLWHKRLELPRDFYVRELQVDGNALTPVLFPINGLRFRRIPLSPYLPRVPIGFKSGTAADFCTPTRLPSPLIPPRFLIWAPTGYYAVVKPFSLTCRASINTNGYRLPTCPAPIVEIRRHNRKFPGPIPCLPERRQDAIA